MSQGSGAGSERRGDGGILRCPACRGPIEDGGTAWRCAACPREYPIRHGIPDLRLRPDPYISFDDEHRKAGRLQEAAARMSFEELVRYYWEITPDVPRPDAERFIRYALDGEQRGRAALQAIDADAGGRREGDACLEIGCGTGGLLPAVRDRFRTVVGADVALRWLVIARKRLQEAGCDATLVCCSAEQLPFADGAFDQSIALHVLEHTGDARAALAETARTLRPGGRFFLATPNRFSLGPEPCVRVWGVGFLPRSMASGYVRLIKGVPYRHIRLLSAFELRRFLSAPGMRDLRICAPRVPEHELRRVSGPLRALVRAYNALQGLPVLSWVLRIVGPLLQATGRR